MTGLKRSPEIFHVKLLLLFLSVHLVSCSRSITLEAFTDGYPGTPASINKTAEIAVPEGWKVAGKERGKGGVLRLWPEPPESGDWGPMIKIIFGRLNPFAPATAEGQVESYLAAVHVKEDHTVVSENGAIVQHTTYGAIPVWYLHSPQFGYRLHAEVIEGNAGFSISLLCDSADELSENIGAFEEILRSVAIKQVEQVVPPKSDRAGG